jgi:hypothetical protein
MKSDGLSIVLSSKMEFDELIKDQDLTKAETVRSDILKKETLFN